MKQRIRFSRNIRRILFSVLMMVSICFRFTGRPVLVWGDIQSPSEGTDGCLELGTAISADDCIKVMINGTYLDFDVQPIIQNNRTLVPLRAIFECFGATVNWDVGSQTVSCLLEDKKISLVVNGKNAYINAEICELDVPAMIIKDRTIVPLRFVAEALGAQVDWNSENKTVMINYEKTVNNSEPNDIKDKTIPDVDIMEDTEESVCHAQDVLIVVSGAKFLTTLSDTNVAWIANLAGSSKIVEVILNDVEVQSMIGVARQSFLIEIIGNGGSVKLYCDGGTNQFSEEDNQLLSAELSFSIGNKNPLFGIPDDSPNRERVVLTFYFEKQQITGLNMEFFAQNYPEQGKTYVNAITMDDVEFKGDLSGRFYDLIYNN